MGNNETNEALQPWSLAVNVASLAVWLLLSFAVAAFGAQFEPGEWYRQLVKPDWTPPGWLFGPVWTFLYIAMAVAAWLVWRKGGMRRNIAPLGFYLLQLIFNGLWSWLFFSRHLIGIALIDIAALLATIIVTTALFMRRQRLAGILMVPYALWVSFATALNAQIFRLN